MNLTEKFKEIVDEYNSKCEDEMDKVIFNESLNSYHFSQGFKSLLTINSDLTIYSDYLDIIKGG